MPSITAIETNWNGIRFRSQLEARWAMFLTLSCIEWKYEPNGRNTAPDFSLECFPFSSMEVKGTMASGDYLNHMRRINCPLIAVSGFFKLKFPLLLHITAKGVLPIGFKETFGNIHSFTVAARHRFDII